MKFNWNKNKNEILKNTRGVSFDEIIEFGEIINVENNPNYSNQKRFIIKYKSYIYSVPYVISGEEVFLKTIIQSRKLKRKYSGDKDNEK